MVKTVVGHTFVHAPGTATFGGVWLDMKVQTVWVLAICNCKDLTWVLTKEWVLSIMQPKTSAWALTQQWVLGIYDYRLQWVSVFSS